MSQLLPITLQALQNDAAALDRIGVNVANLQTAGYRREIAVQAAVLPAEGLPGLTFNGAMQSHANADAAGTTSSPQAAALSAVAFDTRHGTIKTTGDTLDVALMGPGFFEIETESGPAYTRNGSFRVDARGVLTTADGHPVSGKGGHITLVPGPVTIDPTGEVIQNGRTVGQFKVMDLEGTGTLSHVAGGLYVPASTPRPVPDAQIQIRQAALENSNVDHSEEMLHMVQVMRHFEAMTKVVQGYDDMMATAVSRLGSF